MGSDETSLGQSGDYDNDGDVDLADYLTFETCLTGPGAGLLDHCGCVDLDADNDVDLQDFAGFQEAFTGSLP